MTGLASPVTRPNGDTAWRVPFPDGTDETVATRTEIEWLAHHPATTPAAATHWRAVLDDINHQETR